MYGVSYENHLVRRGGWFQQSSTAKYHRIAQRSTEQHRSGGVQSSDSHDFLVGNCNFPVRTVQYLYQIHDTLYSYIWGTEEDQEVPSYTSKWIHSLVFWVRLSGTLRCSRHDKIVHGNISYFPLRFRLPCPAPRVTPSCKYVALSSA